MSASSIAQYLEQRRAARPTAAASEPRKEAWAALANRAAAASDGEPQPFRPLPFKAAAAARAGFVEPPGFGADPAAGRPSSPLLRPREPPPPSSPSPDIEERLSEAYHRGVQEGIDAARSEAATARALERAELQKRAVVEKLDFQMNEYAKFTEAIQQGLKEIERRIAGSVERILRPFLHAAVASRAVEEVAASVAKLAAFSGRAPLMRIRGPEPLLKALKERLGALAVEVEFAPDSSIEITVEASATEIATELGPWADWLDSLGGSEAR